MKTNQELKEALDQKPTDQQIYLKAYEDFERTTERAFENMNESESWRVSYRYNPIYRIYLTSDLYLNKELLKIFTNMVEAFGYRHEFNAPQNAYCIYIKLND